MATHVDLKAVEEFLRNKTYPKGILKDKGKKSNFRKACKKRQHCQWGFHVQRKTKSCV